MERRKLYKTLVFSVAIIISLSAGFTFVNAFNQNYAYPENPQTQSYFTKVANMPYTLTYGPHPETFWEKGGDCDDRARVFANYLRSKGAKDVQICWVCRMENNTMVETPSGDWGHEFIVWDGKVYNPSINESRRFYNYDITSYKVFLSETNGFNTWYFENQCVGAPFT